MAQDTNMWAWFWAIFGAGIVVFCIISGYVVQPQHKVLRQVLLEAAVAGVLLAWNFRCAHHFGNWEKGHAIESMILLASSTLLNLVQFLLRAIGSLALILNFRDLRRSNIIFGLFVAAYLDVWALAAVIVDKNANGWSEGRKWSIAFSSISLCYNVVGIVWLALDEWWEESQLRMSSSSNTTTRRTQRNAPDVLPLTAARRAFASRSSNLSR